MNMPIIEYMVKGNGSSLDIPYEHVNNKFLRVLLSERGKGIIE